MVYVNFDLLNILVEYDLGPWAFPHTVSHTVWMLVPLSYTCIDLFFPLCSSSFVVGLACVDCSASSDTVNLLKQVVDLGCCTVLANKKPLTSTIVIHSYVFN